MTDRLLNEREVAFILGVSVSTLQNWRCTKSSTFFPFVKLSRKAVRYRESVVEKFIADREVKKAS